MDPELGNEYTDYKGMKADQRKHGGLKAATLACVVEMMHSMVILCIGVTLGDYLLKSMHYSVAESSNMVTNLLGTSFLISIVWGFVSDSYITRFATFLFSGALELMGLSILTYQAGNSYLQPPEKKTPSHREAAILYSGLYALAIGVGGAKSTLAVHGADQLDPKNETLISSYFSWYYFSICIGNFFATSVMVWIEENYGWSMSFNIMVVVLILALCIFAAGFPLYRYKYPAGSPFTRITEVLVASVRNKKSSIVANMKHSVTEQLLTKERHQHKLKFLDNSLMDPHIGIVQVEETKSFLGLLPIFATTVTMNCCLAQVFTFSVQQGNLMNRILHNFTIPTQSLALIPQVISLVSIFLLEQFKRMQRNKHTMNRKFYQPLTRMGIGLALVSLSMAVASLTESKRLMAFRNDGKNALSVFWLSGQYILLGISETLTVGGMLEFFYSEAPDSMRSICTSLSWCSSSVGFFMSSVLVSVCNSVSGRFGKEWFGGKDLNHDRLDLFYALLCIINFFNFLLYVYFAKRY